MEIKGIQRETHIENLMQLMDKASILREEIDSIMIYLNITKH
jgi:hypothetical protein